MRKCIRCNIPMINTIKDKKGKTIELKPYVCAEGNNSLYIGTMDKILFDTFTTPVTTAICPKCGEVSCYIEDKYLQEILRRQ